ncbi:hypothetical protein BOTBODRAFT_37653 [Botryobasidium botryosum FD-172 SS1]|uniref:Oxysterol-binding protein n=1 Tax=Botryobasidium botryosum (strain FD-172 SS1) TaxID=930990 RepID=A0A067MAD4_BOTB1|nr:hypothetical protein BOTBODRAFT_37653 [Botryobasidium botryosum FD-172 SS1]
MSSAVAPLQNGQVPEDIVEAEAGVVALPETGEASEGGRLKMIIQLIKRCLGVKDIAAMRLSLPASLLEPIPNLEYWQYLDRPDLFAAINDSSDPFERMLAVLRFTFSKDLKFVRGKIVKPYNSVLGEHFRACWNVKPVTYSSDPREPPIITSHLHEPEDISESRSDAGSMTSSTSASQKKKDAAASDAEDLDAVSLNTGLGEALGEEEESDTEVNPDRVRAIYLTEQVSHHPPISSFYYAVPERGIEACGVDQISAKVAGTTVRIATGEANLGIFVSLKSGHGAGEQYRITHPSAHVNGILRGNFYATMSESAIITCSGGKGGEQLRAIIEYKDESWLGKPQFLLVGVIHTYRSAAEESPMASRTSFRSAKSDDADYESWTKVKQVPANRVVATFEGCWRGEIRWKRPGETTPHVLLDMSTIGVVPKHVRPISEQLPTESRKLWEGVTSNLLAKNFNDATRIKQNIEQEQRDKAAQRKREGVHFVPEYFEQDISTGKPQLTPKGRAAVEELAKSSLKP